MSDEAKLIAQDILSRVRNHEFVNLAELRWVQERGYDVSLPNVTDYYKGVDKTPDLD